MTRNLWSLLFYDFLAFAFILFPLLTGGLAARGPLRIEWADLGPLVGVFTLISWALRDGLRVPIGQARLPRLLLALWNFWLRALRDRPATALWVCAAPSAALMIWRSLVRHALFKSASFDLGIFSEAIWNLSHGNGYTTALKNGANLLTDHQSFVFPCLSPLFHWLPLPESLLVFQALGLASGGVALYYVARPYLQKTSAPLLGSIPLLYWAYLPIRNAAAFDFHPEVLILPTALAAIAGLQSQSQRTLIRIAGALAIVATMATKESGGPIAVGIALAWLLGAGPKESRRFTRCFALALLPAGLAVFAFDVFVLPSKLGTQYAYRANYSQFGPMLSDLLFSPVLHPVLFVQALLDKARLKFLFWTIAPLGFAPLAGAWALIATAPAYLMLFLSNGDARVNILFHYGIECSIGLFWALAPALARLRLRFPEKRLLLWLLFWALATFGRSQMFYITDGFSYPGSHAQWLTEKFLPCVDETVTLSASGHLVPHLTNRRWAAHLPETSLPEGGQVSCVIHDGEVGDWPMSDRAWKALQDGTIRAEYTLTYSCGPLTLYSNKDGKEKCLRCEPLCSSKSAQ